MTRPIMGFGLSSKPQTSFKEKSWEKVLKPLRWKSRTSAARAGDLIVQIQSKGPKFFVGLVALVVVAGIVASVVLFVIPFDYPISGQISTSLCAKCPIPQPYVGYGGENFAAGSRVVINWQSTNSSPVIFDIYNPSIGIRPGDGCSEQGISGTCSFTAYGGGYAFTLRDGNANQTVETITWSGYYTAPLLQHL
jgi:hypothetical protein